MKYYETVRAGSTTPSSDWEININAHSKVLAAGTQFSNSLHIVWLNVLSIMLLLVGLEWSH